MRNSLADVIEASLRVLDGGGLESCSMRRIATELDVQVSALYHHVPNKQTLLGLMADEIVRPVQGDDPRSLCHSLREAMLSVKDGADVVATASAFRLGVSVIEQRLADMVGVEGATTLIRYTFGHTGSTQAHRQALEAGAITEEPLLHGSFESGLDLILVGLEATKL